MKKVPSIKGKIIKGINMKMILVFTVTAMFLLINTGCSMAENTIKNIGTTESTFYSEDEQEINDNLNVKEDEAAKTQTNMNYNEGHMKLQEVMNEINEHSSNLDRGAYIGFEYSTGQLYSYLLALNYRGEDLLDPTYIYKYSYKSFEELSSAYHENVDFTSIKLTNLKHEDFEIFIEIAYTNKKTNSTSFLNYHLNYGKHGLIDNSIF